MPMFVAEEMSMTDKVLLLEEPILEKPRNQKKFEVGEVYTVSSLSKMLKQSFTTLDVYHVPSQRILTLKVDKCQEKDKVSLEDLGNFITENAVARHLPMAYIPQFLGDKDIQAAEAPIVDHLKAILRAKLRGALD